MKDSIQAQQGEMLRRVTYDPQKDSNRYKVRKRSKQKS